MKKTVLKKLIVLIITTCYCINCFAAIISDNDGPAFITKAEFELLKSDFQNQIENYNTSIDSKIDGAISGYLAGVDLAKEPNNLYQLYVDSHGLSPRFYWATPGFGVETHNSHVDAFFDKELAYKLYTKFAFAGYLYTWDGNGNAMMGCGVYIGNEPNWQGASNDWKTLWKGGKSAADGDSNSTIWTGLALTDWTAWNSSYADFTTDIRTTTVNSSNTIKPDDAPVWTILENNGKNSLYLYQTNSSPYLVLNVHRHVYKNYASLSTNFYMTDGGKVDYDTSATTITATTVTSFGEKTYGTNYTGSSTSIGNYLKVNLQKIETNNNIDYRNVIFPTSNDNIWYVTTSPTIKLETSDTSMTLSNNNWYDIYWKDMSGGRLQTNLLYGATLKYKKPYYKASQALLRSFEIPYVSSLAGETTYHGQGFPILQAVSDDTDCTIKIKIKNNLNNTEKVTCLFSDKKIVNGTTFDTSASIKKTEEFNCNTEYTIDFEGIKKEDMIWMNPISGPGSYVYIDNVTAKVK